MNRIYLVIFSSILLFASSCVKSEVDENMPKAGSDYLEVNENILIKGEQTSTTLSIDASDNCNWTVSCSDALVSNISPSSGKGNGSVTITTTANPSALSSRSATISVKNSSGAIDRKITFIQAASDEYIKLSETEMEISSKGDKRKIHISSNTHWAIGISGGDGWISMDETKKEGDNDDDVIITIVENTTKNDRDAVVTISGSKGTTKTFSIRQIRATYTDVTDPQISDVKQTSAVVTFSYSSNKDVTIYGICYSTDDNPTRENATNIPQTPNNDKEKEAGTPSISLTGLTVGTRYYVRAYAMNGEEIKYSPTVVSFATANDWPGEDDNNLPNI